jgi:hypothetical protein
VFPTDYQLTLLKPKYSIIPLEKLIVIQLVNKLGALMEPEGYSRIKNIEKKPIGPTLSH